MWRNGELERCHFCSSYNHTIKNDVWFFYLFNFFHLKWGLCLAGLCLGLTSLWKIPPVMCHLASCTSAGSIPLLVSSQPAVIKCALKLFRMGAKAKPPFFLQTMTHLFSHDTVHQWGGSPNSMIILFYCLLFCYLTKLEPAKRDVISLLAGQMLSVFFFFCDILCWNLLQKHWLSKQSADCAGLTYHLFITAATDCKSSARPPQKKKKKQVKHITSELAVCVYLLQVSLVTCLRGQTPTTPSTWPRDGTGRLSSCWGECVSERKWKWEILEPFVCCKLFSALSSSRTIRQ